MALTKCRGCNPNGGGVVTSKIFYACCVTITLALYIFISSCDYAEPSATITILDWRYKYDNNGETTDIVEVKYRISNTGVYNLVGYRILFVAKCEHTITYEEWITGKDLSVEDSREDIVFMNVSCGATVVNVRIADYMLIEGHLNLDP
ncbi:hypothetical protein ACFL6S_16830 [Candidatus Poribacteria bacterium]